MPTSPRSPVPAARQFTPPHASLARIGCYLLLAMSLLLATAPALWAQKEPNQKERPPRPGEQAPPPPPPRPAPSDDDAQPPAEDNPPADTPAEDTPPSDTPPADTPPGETPPPSEQGPPNEQQGPPSAQDVPPEQPVQQVQNDQPAFYVNVDVDRPDRRYRAGDQLKVRVTAEVDCCLYVLYQPVGGKLLQIFPNRVHPDPHVKGKQPLELPTADDRFRWEISAPFGREQVWVIASREPLDVLSGPELKLGDFTPVGDDQIAAVAQLLRARQDASWTHAGVEVQTVSADAPPSARSAKRVAVCFGLAEYQFNAQHLAAQGPPSPNPDDPQPHPLNLSASAEDARKMADFFNSLGHVDEARLYRNAEVTRANIQFAITRWLPEITQPGDTVFIYYSGHGGSIPDDNGDERDRMDETITTHELVTYPAFVQLQREFDHLPRHLKQLVQQLQQQIAHLSTGDARHAALTRITGISDDVMGLWLQKLSGRKVVLILDSCFSGGFAAQEKGADPSLPRRFDFLDSEVTRLKDLGQADQALLAACRFDQTAAEIRPEQAAPFGLMTELLLDGMRSVTGPVLLDQAYQICSQQLAEINRSRAAEQISPLAQIITYRSTCREDVVLRPR